MDEESEFGMLWWFSFLEEEEQKYCPNCGSEQICYDEDRQVWICLNCDYQWNED